MPEYVITLEYICSDVKSIFKEQQASHIDEAGNFLLVSSLHRSLVANRVEGMKKIQKKVNHAYITKRRNEGAIGFSSILSLLFSGRSACQRKTDEGKKDP